MLTQHRVAVLHCIRGPELYPFVLSIGIIFQAIMLAVAQAQGLNGVYLAKNCPELSGVVWLGKLIYAAQTFLSEAMLTCPQLGSLSLIPRWF